MRPTGAKIDGLIDDLEQEMKGKDQAAIERQASALDQEASRVLRQAETSKLPLLRRELLDREDRQPGGPADDDVVDAEFEEVD